MLNTSVLYLPIGRKTFDIEVAEQYRKQSESWLQASCAKVIAPSEILTSVEELEDFLQSIHHESIDTLLYQSVTFADGEFMVKALEYFTNPVVVWSVREPSVGSTACD
ncbi:hypothetical protein OC195_11380 [Priestia flexa]|nr:hypothetical protein OC195_11380 [Priestia flexa]